MCLHDIAVSVWLTCRHYARAVIAHLAAEQAAVVSDRHETNSHVESLLVVSSTYNEGDNHHKQDYAPLPATQQRGKPAICARSAKPPTAELVWCSNVHTAVN